MHRITKTEVTQISNEVASAIDSVLMMLHSEQCATIERTHLTPAARLEAVLQMQAIMLATERALNKTMHMLHAE